MKTHLVTIGAVSRQLPIIEVAPGVSVALLNLLGDTDLTEEAGRLLAAMLPPETDVLVTPEVKAVPLAHVIAASPVSPTLSPAKPRSRT